MDIEDFRNIQFFRPKEIEATGAKLEDVDTVLIKRLDKLRNLLGLRIDLIKNGMTTGRHVSEGHKLGRAADVFIPTKNPYKVFKTALLCDLTRIGIYWNGEAYSFHLEREYRKTFGFWQKIKFNGKWIDIPFFSNPIEELNKLKENKL